MRFDIMNVKREDLHSRCMAAAAAAHARHRRPSNLLLIWRLKPSLKQLGWSQLVVSPHYKQSPGLRVHLWPLRMLQGRHRRVARAPQEQEMDELRVVENLLRGASRSLSNREEAKRASHSFGLGESFKPRCSMYGLFTSTPKAMHLPTGIPETIHLPTLAYIYP